MSHFHHALTQLIKRVENATDGECRITQLLVSKPEFDPIDWLESQVLYPKFYWQSRDMREEVVAIGQVQAFSDLASAYPILNAEQRIWGGRTFDSSADNHPQSESCFFFLPQIELVRDGDTWSLSVNLTHGKHQTLASLRAIKFSFRPVTAISSNICSMEHVPDKAAWDRLVNKALSHICLRASKKVVLARQTTLRLDRPLSGSQLLKASRASNGQSYHFMLTLNRQSSFVGSTPERLYTRHNRTLCTEALAGTIGRGEGATQDLRLAYWLSNDRKNLAENQCVVDDIVERLHTHTKSIDIDKKTRLVRLRYVQHLKRNIAATLSEGINDVELLGTLQPTAAVAGSPRLEAKQFIDQYEPFSRGWYAGSIGYISHEKAEFCVAIRSALVLGDSIKLYSGAGIVSGSDAESEWQELDKKMSTLLSLFPCQEQVGVAS
ncbi:isochorismate synthase [Vibrio sp. S4M6]|uniref:isochorismate synthase n=1 Tax=Vibrio sinus TaxID=2946865 RepID=UPI00202A9F96|nr:isochorismate synthase [Vibrio sinus]MCL9783097.1 isochorismate synthase [Vibrio sinus]